MASVVTSKFHQIPNALWERMEKLLPDYPSGPKGGRPRLPPRNIANGIFYVLVTGCQWKAMPRQFGSGSAIHTYFQEWVEIGVFECLWLLALEEYDELAGIEWRWQSIDGAMTKAPLGGEKTGKNPTDRGKLGVKRSVLTDGRGVPIGVAIEGANVHDQRLVQETLDSIPVSRPTPRPYKRQHLCCDKGYDAEAVRDAATKRGYIHHIPRKGVDNTARRHRHGKARRWVVERTHSWMNRARRLLIRWGRNRSPGA
jgi:putative transposase